MFGKKKESGIPVGHYEGIEGFATDYPCRIEVKGDVFEIRRIKPETTVTLPMNRIKSFSAMEEEKFMLKYHGQAKNTSKLKVQRSITWLWNMTKVCLPFGEQQWNMESFLIYRIKVL